MQCCTEVVIPLGELRGGFRPNPGYREAMRYLYKNVSIFMATVAALWPKTRE